MAAVTVGFIGAGKMAQAMIRSMISTGALDPGRMIASDVDNKVLESVQETTGIKTTRSNTELIKESSVIILAVKPDAVSTLLRSVAQEVTDNKLIVSIAAGITTASIENDLPPGSRVVRVMPNSASLIQCGATVYCHGAHSTPEDGALVNELFSAVGLCETLPESCIDAVTGLSGSGPAYGYLAIEALADGGVKMGIPRNISLRLAAQTMLGAAKMVLNTDEHPGRLKDGVCSPEGTTIAGVHQLEKHGFRAALMNAVEAGTLRSKEMSNQN